MTTQAVAVKVMNSQVRSGKKLGESGMLRAGSHELGPNCFCKCLESFQNVPEDDRKRIYTGVQFVGRQ